MGIEIPDWLAKFAVIVAGAFPRIDEDEVNALARTTSQFSDDFGSIANDVGEALAGASGAVGGQGGAQFGAYIRQLTTDGPQVLQGMQSSLSDVSTELQNTSLSIVNAKLQVIEMLAWLAGELLWAAAMAPFTGGASEAAVPALVEATQSVVVSIARTAIKEIAKGAAMMAGMDTLTQAIEIAKGYKKNFDFNEMLDAAGMGALSGAVGMGLGLGAGRILGDAAHTFAGKVGTGVVVGGTSNYITQIIGSAAQGQADFGYLGFVQGAVGGGISAGVHAGLAARGGGGLPGKDLKLPPDLLEGPPALEQPPVGFGPPSVPGAPLRVQANGEGSLLVHLGAEPGPGEEFLTAVSDLPDVLVLGSSGAARTGADGEPIPEGGLGDHLATVWSGTRQQLGAELPLPSRVVITSPVGPEEYPGLQQFADDHQVAVFAPDGAVTVGTGGQGLVVTRPVTGEGGAVGAGAGTGAPGEGGWQVISPTPGSAPTKGAAPAPGTTPEPGGTNPASGAALPLAEGVLPPRTARAVPPSPAAGVGTGLPEARGATSGPVVREPVPTEATATASAQSQGKGLPSVEATHEVPHEVPQSGAAGVGTGLPEARGATSGPVVREPVPTEATATASAQSQRTGLPEAKGATSGPVVHEPARAGSATGVHGSGLPGAKSVRPDGSSPQPPANHQAAPAHSGTVPSPGARRPEPVAPPQGRVTDPMPLPGGGLWFPREGGTALHTAAAHAVPGAEGWKLLVAHGERGKAELGGRLLGADATVAQLDAGRDNLALITCYAAASPADGGRSLLAGVFEASGNAALGPTHEAIVTPAGDVISGVIGVDATGRPVVVPKGDWVVHDGDGPRSLGTASLTEAWARLGATPRPGGPGPDTAVGFAYGVSDAQVTGLARYGYAPVAAALAGAHRPGSFFTALLHMTTPELTNHFHGTAPTVAMVRSAMLAHLGTDLRSPAPRYAHFLAPGQTPDQLLRSLGDPARWTPELGALAPHLAADTFQLDLGVVGADGIPEGAGQLLAAPRTARADGNPFMLARVGDSHFVPTDRGPGGRAVPDPSTVHGVPAGPGPSTWSRPLTPGERALVRQAGADAVRRPDIEQRVELETVAAHEQAVTGSGIAGRLPDHVAQVRQLTARALEGDVTAIDRLDILERMSAVHEQVTTTANDRLNEADHVQLLANAATAAGLAGPSPVAARTAARVHAYQELSEAVNAAVAVPPPPGRGIRARIGTLGAVARQAKLAAGIQARDRVLREARDSVPLQPPANASAEALAAGRTWHQQRVREAEQRAAGPARQAQLTAENTELQRHAARLYGPDQQDRLTWASLMRTEPHAVRNSEQLGAGAAEHTRRQIEDPHRDPAQSAAEWRLRREAARQQRLRTDPPRQLPPGFAELDAHNRRQYPLGYRGRVQRIGATWIGDDAAMANLVSRNGPAGTSAGARRAVNRVMREQLTRLGGRAVTQQMLEEGGLRSAVTVGGVHYELNVSLDLGDPARARYQPAFEAQGDERDAPAVQQQQYGQKHHGAVEGDHENIAGSRTTGSSGRSVSAAVNVAVPFGELPAKIFSATAEFSLGGDSAKGWSFGNDGVSATKRFLDLGGQESHFEFPDAAVRIEFTRRGAPAPAHPQVVPTSTRLAFPKELTPRQQPGNVGVLPAPAARRGTTRPYRGITAQALDAGGPVATATAGRITSVLGQVMHIPESLSGLGRLRQRVVASLPAPAVALGSPLHDGIGHWISEPNLLRNYGDLSSVGAMSPAYRTADGKSSAVLDVQSRMLGAQRVGTDPVPMKEESQRWVNTNSGTSESGGFGITPIKGTFGYTVGDPTLPFGFNHSASVGFNLGARFGTTRSHNQNTGAGEVRGLVYPEKSVLFRVTSRVDVRVFSDLPGLGHQHDPLVTEDVTQFIRVPAREADRFEALISREAAGAPATAPWTAAHAQVHPDLDPRPRGAAARNAMVTAEAQVRHPPVALAADRGIGFSAISRLAGAERVIPTIEQTLRRVEFGRTWAPKRTTLEDAYLRRQLLAKYSREGLINRGSALFKPGGVKDRFYRQVPGGTEEITVRVVGHKVPTVPPVAGRVDNAKLELMPAGFAGGGGGDSLSATLSGAVNGGFTAGVGKLDGSDLRQFGFSGEAAGSKGDSASTSVGSSGFQLHAMLYEGPARTFDYQVEYRIEVGVKRLGTPLAWSDLPGRAYQKVKALFGPQDPFAALIATRLRDGRRSLPAVVRGDPGNEHTVRFVVPENLALTTPHVPPAQQRLRPGHLTRVPQRDPVITRINHEQGLHRPIVDLPDLPAALKNAHRPLHGDDLVMETIGSEHLESEVQLLLQGVGISPEAAGDISWTSTGTEMLSGAQVRGPSPITATLSKQGIIKDRDTIVRIEAFPQAHRPTPQRINTLRMDVAEGGSNVSGSLGGSATSRFKVGASFGALAHQQADSSSQQVFPGFSRSGEIPGLPNHGYASSHTLGPVSGRLTQVRENFQEQTADVVYRITVINQSKNMFGSSLPRVRSSVLRITDGVQFLRRDPGVHPDPHDPALVAATNPAPAGLPTLLRSNRPAGAGVVGPQQRPNDRVVPTFAATPHDAAEIAAGRPGRTLPVEPLVPHVAASERLLVPANHPGNPVPHPRRTEVSGDGNPLLDRAQELLQQHAEGALEDYWQVHDGAQNSRHQPVPTKLANLLNVGSSEALLDTALGSGLILHTTDSGALHNNRTWLRLRATRDPDNKGYHFVEQLPQASVSRYHFRLNREEQSRSRPESREWGLSSKFAENPSNTGTFKGVGLTPSGGTSRARGTGSSSAGVDASRNTLFISGPADRYAGDLRIEMTVVRTTHASRFLNTALLTVPEKIALATGHLDMGRADGTGSVTLTERVLIPKQLHRPDLEPYVPAPNHVAVAEVPRGQTVAGLGGRPLGLSKQHLLDRKAVNLGFDHDKLRVLTDEVLARLAGNTPTQDGSQNFSTKRTAALGSRSRDAIHAMLSHPMMTNELEFMVDANGLVSPVLVREGGLLTDTHARITVQVEPFDARVQNHFDGWLESNSYHFNENGQNESSADGWSIGGSAGFTGLTGSTDAHLPPGSHEAQKPTGTLSVGANQSSGKSSFVVHKDMPRVVSRNREVPWLRTKSDAIVRITVEARNVRGPINVPGGTTRMDFHVRNGLEIGFTPELAHQLLDSQALHSNGTPTRSGVIVPVRGHATVPDDGPREFQAAASFPKVDNTTVVHVHGDPAVAGNFLVGNRSLTTPQFQAEVLARHNLTPGQALVLVGCDVNTPVGGPGGPTAAGLLGAANPGVHIITAGGAAFTGPDGSVLAGNLQYDANGRPQTGSWQPGSWQLSPGGGGPVVDLGPDLAAALRAGIDQHLPPGAVALPHPVVVTTPAVLPPAAPVRWGGTGSSPAFPTRGAGRPPVTPLTVIPEEPEPVAAGPVSGGIASVLAGQG
ncbi:hypothetical protein [Streptacidiphilus sp. EB129]|uniref:WXG100-like domain-containing protein n=1 Tax=Streptacidiphilus sp. EB129 TaxID=3156262 RepID=UPI003512053E